MVNVRFSTPFMIGLSDINVADVLKVDGIEMAKDCAVILHSGIAGQSANAMPRCRRFAEESGAACYRFKNLFDKWCQPKNRGECQVL